MARMCAEASVRAACASAMCAAERAASYMSVVTERLASLSKVNCRSESFRVDLTKSPQGKG